MLCPLPSGTHGEVAAAYLRDEEPVRRVPATVRSQGARSVKGQGRRFGT